MDNVKHFAAKTQALENVPHMLRYFADMIERDSASGAQVEVAALVLVNKGDPQPAFFTFGDRHDTPNHPLFVAGVFDYCRTKMLTVVEREDDHQ